VAAVPFHTVLSDFGNHFDVGFVVMVFVCIVFCDFRMSVRHECKRGEALVACVERVPGDETMIIDIVEERLVSYCNVAVTGLTT
jgi:hypothetical protein